MQAFLTKPIDPEMLFETIGALTGAGPNYPDQPVAAAAPTTSPSVAVLDESVLKALDTHAYSPQFVADVVASFESDMVELLERLDASLAKDDWDELADVRHAIEGTASGSGASRIVALAQELRSFPDMAQEARQARLAALRPCFFATREAMQHFLARQANQRADAKAT